MSLPKAHRRQQSLPDVSRRPASSKRKLLHDEADDEDDDGGSDPLLVSQKAVKEETFIATSLRDFEPKSSKELAISSQKLNELKSWFRQQFGEADEVTGASTSTATSSSPNAQSPFLLLNGPSGAGKTAAIKLLCREFAVVLVELPTASLFKEDNRLSDEIGHLAIAADVRYKRRLKAFDDADEEQSRFDRRFNYAPRPLLEESQQSRFHRFLTELQLYRRSVLDRSSGGRSAAPRKLLLIEDIPPVFHLHPERLHAELLALFQRFGAKTVPTVFIFSDLTNTTSTENAELKLLPKWLQAKLNLQVISLKPVTEAAMKRTLKRLNKAHLKETLSTEAIEAVVAASPGDIRNALNYLIFRHSVPPAASSSSSSTSKRTSKKAKVGRKSNGSSASRATRAAIVEYGASTSSAAAAKAATTVIESGREDQLTLTHAVGKIMYAKRFPEADPAAVDYLKRLPTHSTAHFDRSLLRNVLQEQQPEAIGERASASADTLLEWSHENYVDFLSTSAGDAAALSQAIDCLQVLSTADASLRVSDGSSGCFEGRGGGTMEALRSAYIIRGQMFSLNQDGSAYTQLLQEMDCCQSDSSQQQSQQPQQQQQKIPAGQQVVSSTFKRNTFTFHQLRGPKFWAAQLATLDNRSMLAALKASGLLSHCQAAVLESDRNLAMDILPAICSISSVSGRLAALADPATRSFVEEMANCSGQQRLAEDQGGGGGGGAFIRPSVRSAQQYTNPSSSLAIRRQQPQRKSPFLGLSHLPYSSSSDDEELVLEADSD